MFIRTIHVLRKFCFKLNNGVYSHCTRMDLLRKASSSTTNRQARIDLATAYRTLHKMGLNEGVCNHLTMMAPSKDGREEVMLLIPYGILWSEVTASSLIGLNQENKIVEGEGRADISAATIHRGIHDGLPDAHCVMHTHMPYATALTLLKDPQLRMVHQNSLRFYKSIVYDMNYTGVAAAKEEGDRLAALVKDKPLTMAIFLGNHGIITVGDSVAEAFDRIYYLERAAMHQVLAMSTGRKLSDIPMETCIATHQQWRGFDKKYAHDHFNALRKKLLQNEPETES